MQGVIPMDASNQCPVLVITYDDNVRSVLARTLEPFGSRVEICSSFCEAEKIALLEPCKGLLVDLTAMIKSKAEEKTVAYTLTRFFPTLRVRAMGPMIIPMMMPGDAKQDKSLNDFLSKTCAGFVPRRLRTKKRADICVPTFIGDLRGFTLNLSWTGVFIADMNPERFSLGERLSVSFPEFNLEVEVEVARIQLWGQHRPPGIGVKFLTVSQELDGNLSALLRSNKNSDHDRQIT